MTAVCVRENLILGRHSNAFDLKAQILNVNLYGLYKLERYGFRDSLLSWFYIYLTRVVKYVKSTSNSINI